MAAEGLGSFFLLGVSLLIAWLMTGEALIVETREHILHIKIYFTRLARIVCLTTLITTLLMFMLYKTGISFLDIDIYLTEERIPPIVFVIAVFAAAVLLWVSFGFKQLDVDKWRREVVFKTVFFITLSRTNIPFTELSKVLLVKDDSGDTYYRLYLETKSGRKELFGAPSRARVEKTAVDIGRLLELDLQYEDPRRTE
jgi:hypothetical protein